MGKKAATVSVSGAIAVVFISLVFMQPVRVDAASLSDQLVKRLCDRQEKLGGRLVRALINPSRCATTPPPEEEEPTVILTADPMTITVGSSTTLTWNSDNATTCTASNGWSGDKALDGSQSVSPATTTTYAISCTGDGGTANDSVTVTVNAAPDQPTLEFTASPTEITSTGTSTLTWASTNATSCAASGGWSGAKALSGNEVVSPNATTTYSLTCTGAGGDIAKNVTVNVIPATPDQPTVDLSASRTTVNQNSSSTATTTLTWTTTNATTCTASGGAFTGTKAVNDSETITPSATTTYMLECSGPGGSANDSVTVNFVPEEMLSLGHVVISEVLYDAASTTPGEESGNEWIEVYNGTDSAIDLMGWSTGTLSATSSVINISAVVQPGAYAVIAASSTPAGIPGGVTVVILNANINSGGLANGGDAVFLRDSSSTIVDAVSWESNTDAFTPAVTILTPTDDGHSIARVPVTFDTNSAVDWVELASPTPGQ